MYIIIIATVFYSIIFVIYIILTVLYFNIF